MCLLATAMGDDKAVLHYLTEAAQERGFAASHLSLFPMPKSRTSPHTCSIRTSCGCSAAVSPAYWLCGGCTASTPRSTRPGRPACPHRYLGRIDLLARRWNDGLVRTTTATGDRRARLRALRQRRPLRLRGSTPAAIAEACQPKVLPAAYATDDGAGVLYRGTEFVEAVSEKDGAAVYFVELLDGPVVETQLDTRRL